MRPEEEKIRRIMSLGKSEREAVQLVQEVDSERAAFIRHYFNKEWPLRSLYNLMINSKYGDEHTIETILQEIASLEARGVPQAASQIAARNLRDALHVRRLFPRHTLVARRRFP